MKSLDKKKTKELPKKAVGHYTIQNQPNVMNIISLKIPKESECGYCKKVQQNRGGNLGYQCKRHTKHASFSKITLYTEEQVKTKLTQQRTELEQQKVKVVWNDVCEQIKKETRIELLEEIKKEIIKITDNGYDCVCSSYIEDYFKSLLNKKDE